MAIIKNLVQHSLENGKRVIKNGAKNGVNGNGIKGYIAPADRLKIPRKKDGSIHLNTKDKDFNLKKDAIRSEIIDKKSNDEFGNIFVDGVHKHGKFNTGITNIKSLGDVKFQNKSVTKKSSKKRAKATKATSLTDDIAQKSYMRWKQITDPSELSQYDWQQITRYVDIRKKQFSYF